MAVDESVLGGTGVLRLADDFRVRELASYGRALAVLVLAPKASRLMVHHSMSKVFLQF